MDIEIKEQPNQESVTPENQYSPEQLVIFREMIAAGVVLGRKKTVTNPKMDKYILNYSKGVAVFNAEETLKLLDKAAAFLKDLVEKKMPLLIVGTQPAAKDIVENFAKKFGFSYVTERWLGGTLTNLKVINQRVQYYLKIKADMEAGNLEKYTKKERLLINRDIERMRKMFTGLDNLNYLPAVVLVVDAVAHETAVREARRLKIPIVAIMNNDNNPEGIAYPIPANDNLRSSLNWVFGKLEQSIDANIQMNANDANKLTNDS